MTKSEKNLESAMSAFNAAGVDITADFHTLDSSKVQVIVDLAKQHGYRKPKDANGSTARYYFESLARAHKRNSK